MARIRRNPTDTSIPEKIILASMKVFGAEGYEGANMKAIAREAGVTPAALYYHYKDKRELLALGLEAIAQMTLDAVRMTPEEIAKDPRKALRRYVTHYITFQLTEIRTIAPMYTSLVHGTRQRAVLTERQMRKIRALEHQHLDILRDILRKGQEQKVMASDSATMTAFAILGMCEHTLTWVNPAGKAKIEDIAKHFAQLALKLTVTGSGSA